MSEKIKLTITEGEDSCDILTPSGKVLCTIYRDEDSCSTAITILTALVF